MALHTEHNEIVSEGSMMYLLMSNNCYNPRYDRENKCNVDGEYEMELTGHCFKSTIWFTKNGDQTYTIIYSRLEDD